MIQDELRALYDQISDEEKNENGVLKGRFTKYITRLLEWHAIRYAAHKGKSIVTISLDNILDEPQDERAAEMFREVEIKVALQQELQRLKQEEKELLVYLLALDIGKIALQIDFNKFIHIRFSPIVIIQLHLDLPITKTFGHVHSTILSFLYCAGDFPISFLNTLLKYSGFSYPTISEISLML